MVPTKVPTVDARLAEDSLGRHCADTRYIRQIYPKKPIEFAAKIKQK